MSWGITIVGKPAALIKALDEYSGKLNGASKTEFDEVLPGFKAIIGAVKQSTNEEANPCALFKLTASGHGVIVDGQKQQNTVSMSFGTEYVNLVQ